MSRKPRLDALTLKTVAVGDCNGIPHDSAANRATETIRRDAVPFFRCLSEGWLRRRRRTLNVCRGAASHISPAATSRSKAGGSDRN